MPAKQIVRDADAQQALMAGVNTVANAVRLTLGPRGQNVILEKKWGCPSYHQRRNHHRQRRGFTQGI